MKTVTAYEIMDWVVAQVGHPLNGDEGVTYGPARQAVKGVTVCWMPDAAAVEAAVAAGHQLLIHHEALTFPYPALTETRERHYLAWPANRARLRALSQSSLTSLRIHGSADERWINDAMLRRVGLVHPEISGPEGWQRIFCLEPTPYGRFIERIKKAVGMTGVRATRVRSPETPIRRVALSNGGSGLFVNLPVTEWFLEYSPDVILAGETDNYAMRFCTEAGVDLVEVSHEVSEQPGVADMAADLAAAFPQLEVRFLMQDTAWQMV